MDPHFSRASSLDGETRFFFFNFFEKSFFLKGLGIDGLPFKKNHFKTHLGPTHFFLKWFFKEKKNEFHYRVGTHVKNAGLQIFVIYGLDLMSWV